MAVQVNSLKNLEKRVKFKKGVQPPGAGKPKYKDLMVSLREAMTPEVVNKIIGSLTRKAMKGDQRAAEFIANRLHGLPTQHIIAEKAPVITVEHNVIQISEAEFEGMRAIDPYDAIKPKQLPTPVMVIDEQQLKSKTQLP